MVASNNHEKEQWIGAIGKAMVKLNIKKNSFDDDEWKICVDALLGKFKS